MQVCAALPGLRHLDASYGDVQMHAPSALPLAHLHLSRGATAGEALPPSLSAATAPAPALTFLSVAGRVITHPLVTLLAALADLRYLDISACALVEEEAPMLAPLSRLRRLRGVRMRHMLGRFNYLASGAGPPAPCRLLEAFASGSSPAQQQRVHRLISEIRQLWALQCELDICRPCDTSV